MQRGIRGVNGPGEDASYYFGDNTVEYIVKGSFLDIDPIGSKGSGLRYKTNFLTGAVNALSVPAQLVIGFSFSQKRGQIKFKVSSDTFF